LDASGDKARKIVTVEYVVRKWSKAEGDGDDGLGGDYEELHENYILRNKPRLGLIEYLKIKLIHLGESLFIHQ